jgi:hypothetical protein
MLAGVGDLNRQREPNIHLDGLSVDAMLPFFERSVC